MSTPSQPTGPRPGGSPANRSSLKRAEHALEFMLLASRWLLMPLYVMLMAVLVVFGATAGRELGDLFADMDSVSEAELILSALALIDLALVGALLVMVALSGYETFVSRFDHEAEVEKPAWLGKLDLGTVKLKLAASIVAISGIHLLKQYMSADKAGEEIENERLLVLAAIHLAFVVSALLLALVDRAATGGKPAKTAAED